MPSSQNEYSHYTCDDNGDVKCLPGWQGDLCDVPICRKGCDPLQGMYLISSKFMKINYKFIPRIL